MSIIVTGSIAFDYLMSFPGKFTEHLLPEHVQRVSLSFLVDTMDKRRGGCAPNIAYTLALLGERPRLMATAGQDFGDYRALARGRRRRHVAGRRGAGQVHGVVLLQHRPATTTRSRRSTPAPWRMPPSCRSGPAGTGDAGDHLAERSRRRCCSTRRSAARWRSRSSSIPGQQCARMSGDAAADGARRRGHGRSATTTSSSCCGRRPAWTRRTLIAARRHAGRHAGRARLRR